MRILVVDDAEDSREIIEAALVSSGYRDIAGAASGWDALELLEVGREVNGRMPAADIVLLDIMMPEMDGIETCARIRNDARYADTPIIMVTSVDEMKSLASAFVAGANDYVNKPLNRVELVARVRSALKLKAELERRQARERELLQFLANWSDRHGTEWIDEATGLFVGAAAEAYLTAVTERRPGGIVSVLALAVDRLGVIRVAQGEEVASHIRGQIAQAVLTASAAIGVVAASYPNGLIAVIGPELGAVPAKELGETLRRSIADLAIANAETMAADHVTVSVAVVTGRVKDGIDRVKLLTQAISRAQGAARAGGNRVVAVMA